MKLFSLTSLITSILLIYLIFTLFNDGSNTNKIITVTLLFLLGMYLFNHLDIFKNYTSFINTKMDASKTTIIPRDKINTNDTYSLSMWLYIDDWNYKFGEKKEIIKRVNNRGNANPFIYFDLYENNIISEFYVKPPEETKDNYEEALKYCKNPNNETYQPLNNKNKEGFQNLETSGKCSLNPTTGNYELINEELLTCKEGTYYCLDNRKTEYSCDSNEGTTTLFNVPLQKWFHVSYAFGHKHVDIYLNGKLIHTKTFNGIQFVEDYLNSDFVICDNGGFSGSITKVKYYNHMITPQNVWDIYKEGFNQVVLSSLFNRFNASVTFYEDNNEKVKYYLV